MGKGGCTQCMVHFLVVLGFSLLWLGASVLHLQLDKIEGSSFRKRIYS